MEEIPKEQTKTSGSRATLREAILSGHYMPGTSLPSVRTLAKEMNISKTLVQNILQLLQEEGLVKSAQGRGVIVLDNNAKNPSLKRVFVRPSDYGTFRYFPVASELLQAVSAGAEKKNVEILLSFSDSIRLNEDIIAHYLAGTIQGVIYFQCADRSLIEPLEKAQIPYVIASEIHGYRDLVSTYVDFRKVARQAVKYLYQMGHRDIGIITGSQDDYTYSEIFAGFRGAMAEENLEINPNWVLDNLAFEQAKDQVKIVHKYLSQKRLPTAIFTTRDYRAKWLYEAAKQKNLSIPDDISVISFDNHSWDRAGEFGLTSIEEPLRAQGENAVEMLQNWVRTKTQVPSRNIDTKLIERLSVKTV